MIVAFLGLDRVESSDAPDDKIKIDDGKSYVARTVSDALRGRGFRLRCDAAVPSGEIVAAAFGVGTTPELRRQ